MEKTQYESLLRKDSQPSGDLASRLTDKTPRTLLYGYTSDRLSWHVYLDEAGTLHKVMYLDSLLVSHDSGSVPDAHLIPNKRLYPEDCDFEACSLLRAAGVSLPFTSFNEDKADNPRRPFAGARVEDLTPSVLVSAGPLIDLARRGALATQYIDEALARGGTLPVFSGVLTTLLMAQEKFPKLKNTDSTVEYRVRLAIAMEHAARQAKLPCSVGGDRVGGLGGPRYSVSAERWLPAAELPAYARALDAALAMDELWSLDLDLFLEDSGDAKEQAALRIVCDKLRLSRWAHDLEATHVAVIGRLLLVQLTAKAESVLTSKPHKTRDGGKTLVGRRSTNGSTALYVAQRGMDNSWMFACTLFGEPLKLPQDDAPISLFKL